MKKIFVFFFTTLFCFILSQEAYCRTIVSDIIEAAIDSIEPPLPLLSPMLNYRVKNTNVCKGPNNFYYLTGESGDETGAMTGIKVWASDNLKDWRLLGANGYVWILGQDSVKWHLKEIKNNDIVLPQVQSPRLYFIKGTYWVTYSIAETGCSGLLKSTTGRPDGPFVEISPNKPLVKGYYPSLYVEPDSTVWYVWDQGNMVQMSRDMSAIVPETQTRVQLPSNCFINQGINLSNYNGKVYLTYGSWNAEGPQRGHYQRTEEQIVGAADSRFDCMAMVADNIRSFFSEPFLAVPHGSSGHLFLDKNSQLSMIVSGDPDASSPFSETPAQVPLTLSENFRLKPKTINSYTPEKGTKRIYVSHEGDNSSGSSWSTAFTSIQRAIEQINDNTQVWISAGEYDAPIKINLKNGVYIYGGFSGTEDSLQQRNPEKNKVIINGKGSAMHVVTISTSSFVRIDGLTIQGGNATGGSFNHRFGGGIYVIDGGETIRILNCTIENNSAEQDGGGLYASIGSTPTLINCTFRNNVAKRNGGALAIYCNFYNGYNAQLYNCTLDSNVAYENGGCTYFDTNMEHTGLLKFVNCIISSNKTIGSYGNIALDRGSSLLMTNSVVYNNIGEIHSAVAGRTGRAPAQSRIINSVFIQNKGGFLFNVEGDSPAFGNDSYTGNAWVQFMNCIFNGNNVSSLVKRNYDNFSWETVDELNWNQMGEGNLSSKPLFKDLEKGDFHSGEFSPGIGTGTYESTFILDYDGNYRYRNNDSSFRMDIGINNR